jgi:hypothetical protein
MYDDRKIGLKLLTLTGLTSVHDYMMMIGLAVVAANFFNWPGQLPSMGARWVPLERWPWGPKGPFTREIGGPRALGTSGFNSYVGPDVISVRCIFRYIILRKCRHG